MKIFVYVLLAVAGVYLVAGFIACIFIRVRDLSKKRISMIAGLEDVVTSHGVAWFIYLLLWPVWLLAYLQADEKGSQPTVLEYGAERQKLSDSRELVRYQRPDEKSASQRQEGSAEPGATDNPDDAKRLREDH